ncbi:hypothetical protein JQ634_26285 [Bradyrhizobium sp. AUGA SZCCT0240]|uniref:hypothetical protein n=1 Tax=unclassified Bradyrhizobium TaxID=2631580 RepID=UPI001BA8E7D2|nr:MULTISPECIES: hypothetical protein [unclassified Bradyrhizobium]MBR1196658.1 hypothetical protein [Bradyrhizobium sp. AUGA SZCCT0158]MBR1242407.1 hypothetical protein [Bradyrhizobium sp. AUGA SZCCT0274]MBR1257186.1 hypothetical protein [Bradyrhizobium sp. AUGA SZCCT0240]
MTELPDDKNYMLLVVLRLLANPPLLPNEKREDFIQLFESLEAYGKPRTDRDLMAVYQATVLTWDILRYQDMKVGVLRSHRRSALVSLLSKTHEGAAIPGAEAAVMIDADQKATRWFADPASRPGMAKMIENAGYPQNALDVEAFQRALPALATIDRLIVSAQKRLDRFLKELEESSSGTAEALRSATTNAIAAKTPDQESGAKK